MPHRFSPGKSTAAHPPQGRNPAGEKSRREEIRRGEGVLPRKLFGGKHRRPPVAGEKSAGERDVLPRKVFTGGKRHRPPTAGKKSAGERGQQKSPAGERGF